MNLEIICYAVYGFVALCVLLALAGAIHGFVYWGADCIQISGIIYFGLHVAEFYINIVFDLELLNHPDHLYLFYLYSASIVISWIANMISLRKHQNIWCKDDAIRERVHSWFVSWQFVTYVLAAISGSAFGPVVLSNSYVFGLDFFCMGLNERHLKRFNMNRLWSSIIPGNMPQLIIQFWFLSTVNWKPETGVVWMAMCFSLPAIVECVNIYSTKKLFEVLDPIPTVSCSINIMSQEIKENATRLQITTYALRDAVAETLTTHCRAVEIHFPTTLSGGFKVMFTVFSATLGPDVIYSRLISNAQVELPKKIKNVWRLLEDVQIPLDDIVVNGVDKQLHDERESSVDF